MEATMELPATDDEGYLIDPAEWSEALAVALARQENIDLTEAHWDAIRFIRSRYQERQVIPDVRFVIRHLADLGAESRNRIFELFPYGYVKQACKIAGMRRPRGWSTG
ncbi:MAG: TusE/DsrC/DsvC family sulfur relay protein [Rhodocyclales bacterium]|nr:TusE/DsrC/DsvC family sulfur relay protein [Rhodocyclales bacterium]